MSLDTTIEPEIVSCDLAKWLEKLAAREDVRTILEIGSSDGRGSTTCLIRGKRMNPSNPKLFCFENNLLRFKALSERWGGGKEPNVILCFDSAVNSDGYMTKEQVIEFYNSTKTNLNKYPIEQVLSWLKDDLKRYAEKRNQYTPKGMGIDYHMDSYGITIFDLVFIDGSAFTAQAELAEIYGAKIIVIDDAQNDIKNFHNYHRLKNDPAYRLLWEDAGLRNGAAIFEKNV